MTEKNLQKKPYPLGAHIEEGGVRFSFVSRAMACGVLLYDRAAGRMLKKIPFSQEDRIGNVYCKTVGGIDAQGVSYLFFEEDDIVPDERARCFQGKAVYGRERTARDLKAVFPPEDFDWGQDQCPRIPYSRMLGYGIHVRGFTKHVSSRVRNRGTFAGIVEKIPYLKEIGVTTIELQPAYEFTEIPTREEWEKSLPTSAVPGQIGAAGEKKLNYWGYKKGFYYAPKSAYAASGDAVTEFKSLVKALHAEQMELIMQFYFPKDVKWSEIPEILRFWVIEYHVDGFRLLGENLPADALAAEDVLADTKLWYQRFDTASIYGRNESPRYPHAAEYNDAWCFCMRKYLKGDGNMLGEVLYQMRRIPEKAGIIHYLTNYNGFTLADLVSYNCKHNEANGEDNRDGTDYNCSWNCGEEGATRRQKVRQLRLKQMKNAMCMLLYAQSAPLIFMGDEFGNSQKGNNNPYCLDNAVTWLDWGDAVKNAELLAFWKMLVEFRRRHPILRPEKEQRLMDYIACGYPDLSYHGQNAWRPQTEGDIRHIGIMFCGKYAKADSAGEDDFIYLAMNMHWESRELALPRLPKELRWEKVFSTETAEGGKEPEGGREEFLRTVPPRSIAVYISVPAREEETAQDEGIRQKKKGRTAGQKNSARRIERENEQEKE